MRHTWITLAGIVALAVPCAMAQTTTGRLIGRVVDEQSLPLAGTTVIVSSPSLIGGARTQTTEADGEFTFTGIAPGDYAVQASLSGYVTQERTDVKVPLGGAAMISVRMPRGTFEDEIEVTSETPVVDPTQVNTELVFDRRYLQGAAIGSSNRSYQSMLTQAPGATSVRSNSNPNVLGSTRAENAYYVDGQDTTDPATGTFGLNFAFDAIDEIEFQTSGFEAEFGRATGGFVNLITKSGGNQFSGTLDARYRNNDFQESGEHFDAGEAETSYRNYAVTLGGPILRDRLWFFVAYNVIDSRNTPADSPTTFAFAGTFPNAKLTLQAAPGWRLVGKFSGSPADIDNVDASQFRAVEATSFQAQNTDIYTVEVNAVLSDTLLWNGIVGAYRSMLDFFPMSRDLEAAGTFDYVTRMWTDNTNWQEYSKRNRNDASTDVTWFVDPLAGSHEFKAGFQFSATDFTYAGCSTGTSGGACTPGSVGYVYYTNGGPEVPWFQVQYVDAGPQEYAGQLWTAFVQDSWRVTRDLTLKVGLRYDHVTYDNNVGTQVADMEMFQPRLGVAWDLTGDARNLLRGNWGRFMHPSALHLPDFVRDTYEPASRWYSCSSILRDVFGFPINSAQDCQDVATSNGLQWMQGYEPERDLFGWALLPSQIYGSGANGIDSDLAPTYADTLSLSYERAVGRRASASLTFVDKHTHDIFEDTCNGNTGPDGPFEGAACDFFVMSNLEGLARDYQALILLYETRTLDWLTLLASYTYSKSEGNVANTGNAGSDFDVYPWHFVNRYGYLSDHRSHRLKLNGFFNIKGDWNIGFDAFWSSAFTWTPVADIIDIPEMPFGIFAVEPRGSRDGEPAWNLDLQLSKGFTLGPTRLVLIGTVYNAFSNEYVEDVCSWIRGCGDYELGKPDEWAQPRRYEVGFRVEF